MQSLSPIPTRQFEAVDILLLDVARKVRLQEAGHKLLVERFNVMTEYLNRPESILHGKIKLIYPQGGMSIGAGVSSKLDTDEFDVDMILELVGLEGLSPRATLNLLYDALQGQEGGRYHGKVERKTRCITISYAEMHLDITPAKMLPQMHPRVSHIPHSKLEEPVANDKFVIANPWGMTDWFIEQVSQDQLFGKNYRARFKAEPIPQYVELEMKPLQVIALILLKRFRNLRYSKRDGRMPPSVMLSKMVADHRSSGVSLVDELEFQAQRIFGNLRVAKHNGRLIDVRNPRCPDDNFTDRWPMNHGEQNMFISDLEHLLAQIAKLRAPLSIDIKRAILVDLFGEHPTAWAFDHLANSLEKASHDGTLRQRTSNGGQIALAALSGTTIHSAAALARSAQPESGLIRTPRNTFYGSDPE
jgi:hypothetical protein